MEPTDTDEQSWKRPTISSTPSEASTNPLRAIYSGQRARLMLGCYRKGDANDPDTYVAAIAAVLATFDPEIVREATDPRTGIQSTDKFTAFMPNAGEVRTFCVDLAARKERLERYRLLPPAEPRVRVPVPPDPPVDPQTGKHRPGTILSNFDEAFRLYGRPVNDLPTGERSFTPPPYTGPPFVPHTHEALRRHYGIHPSFQVQEAAE